MRRMVRGVVIIVVVMLFPVFFACFASASAIALESRAAGGYIQNLSGAASFTMYTGCSAPGIAIAQEYIQRR